MSDLICAGCAKHPEDIEEYVDAVKGDLESYADAEDFCWQEEGTLNKATKRFWCTECYIKVGQPLGVCRAWW